MTDATTVPRIEDFRTDLDAAAIAAGEAANTRSIAMQAYLSAFPSFLHLRQLSEYLAGRRVMAPGEPPLGGWFLMRALSTPEVTTVSPNVDTLYGGAYLLLREQGPVVLRVPAIRDRYYSVALMDTSYDNFAIISPRTGGTDGGDWLIVPPGWSGTAPDGFRGSSGQRRAACSSSSGSTSAMRPRSPCSTRSRTPSGSCPSQAGPTATARCPTSTSPATSSRACVRRAIRCASSN